MFKENNNELDLSKLKAAIETYTSRANLIPLEHRKNLIVTECLTLLNSQGYYLKEKLFYYDKVVDNDGLINYYYVILSKHHNIFPVRDFKRDRLIALQFVGRLMNEFNMTDSQARALCVEIINILFEHLEEFGFKDTAFNSFSIFGQGGFKWVPDKALSILNFIAVEEEKNLVLGDIAANNYLKTHDIKLGFDLD